MALVTHKHFLAPTTHDMQGAGETKTNRVPAVQPASKSLQKYRKAKQNRDAAGQEGKTRQR